MSVKNLSSKSHVRHMLRPLTPKQRKLIAVTLGLKAYRRLGTDEPFDDWRRREAREATQRRHPATGEITDPGVTISEAMQMHFDALFLHFKTLAGEASLEDAAPDAQELRQLTQSIGTLQRELGISDAYLGGIIKNITGGARTWSTPEHGRAVRNALRYHRHRQARVNPVNQVNPVTTKGDPS